MRARVNANAAYQAAIAAVQALGATTVQIPTPSPAQNFGEILTAEFKRDLNAYLSRLPAGAPVKSLADIIAYNTAHADEALKFGQTQLTASQAVDLNDPATNATNVANRDGGRAATRAAIDNALTTNTLDAIMTPSGTLTGTARKAARPELLVVQHAPLCGGEFGGRGVRCAGCVSDSGTYPAHLRRRARRLPADRRPRRLQRRQPHAGRG